MSGADLLNGQPFQAPCEDRDEGDFDEGDEMLLRPLDNAVQPAIESKPSERAFHGPADPRRDEGSVATAGDRLDGDAERLPRLGQALTSIAEIAQGGAVEAAVGQSVQDGHDALGVVHVGRRGVDRQRDAVLLNGEMDLHAADRLAAIDAARSNWEPSGRSGCR